MKPKSAEWTPSETQQLLALWKQKKTATEISMIMGLVSRSSVLGKIQRLRIKGLIPKEDDEARNAKVYVAPKIYVRPRVFKPRPALPPQPAPEPTGFFSVTLADLRPNQCKYIEGDYAANDMRAALMCGEPTNKTYCPHHHALTHYAMPPARKKGFNRVALHWASR